MASKLKVQEIRDELSKRGLDTSGLKAVLVARLDEAIASDGQTATAEDKDASQKSDEDNEKKSGKKTHPRDEEDTDDPVKRPKLEDVDKMNLGELKSSLSALGCSTVGVKGVLNKRLKSALQDVGLPNAIASDGDSAEDKGKKMVTAVKKGRAVLDPTLPEDVKSNFHVLEYEDEIYDAMLNQTNVGGNNNKFYVIQALENDNDTSYKVFTRWGRVGAIGQSKLVNTNSKVEAITGFESAFNSKTHNMWCDRHSFTSYPGKYTWLEMDYEPEAKSQECKKDVEPQVKAIQRAPSKLNPTVQKLISVICNLGMMKQQMMEIGYDARKMPLGKLSKSTVLKGYEVLKRISAALDASASQSEILQLTSEFYTVIPHDFGFKKMRNFVIDTPQILKKKLEMVEALGEIELASKLLEVDKESEEDPVFYHYQKLKCAIEPVLDNEETDWIKTYTRNTHGATHSHYSIDIEQIYKIVRDGEDQRFQTFAGEKNRMLLWHGSRLCNWTGILSQGLRIAPPEAPVSGYMFGKGVYFADMVSKSANYCYPNKDGPALLLLCEVALGDMQELQGANYNADQLPQGKLSTKGVGMTAPNSKEFKVLPDGVVVPMGKPMKHVKRANLQYNEYIVYNTAQIRMRYLLMVKFNYGR